MPKTSELVSAWPARRYELLMRINRVLRQVAGEGRAELGRPKLGSSEKELPKDGSLFTVLWHWIMPGTKND
jgi:hypothetical protein